MMIDVAGWTLQADKAAQRPILPVEIHERIIDSLSNHPKALATCGLVCRAMVPRTRFHLFTVVHLRKRKDCIRLEGILRSSAHTRNPISPLIRAIRIGWRPLLHPEWFLPSLMSVLPLMGAVEAVTLWEFSKSCTLGSVLFCLRVLPPRHVRRLDMWNFKFFPDELYQLISLFPALNTFEIYSPRPLARRTAPLAPIDKPLFESCIRITHLTVCMPTGKPATCILSLLAAPVITLSLEQLYWNVDLAVKKNDSILKTIISHSKSTLSRLAIHVSGGAGLEDPVTSVDLSSLSKLSSLYIAYSDLPVQTVHSYMWKLMSSLPPHILHDLPIKKLLLGTQSNVLPQEKFDAALESLAQRGLAVNLSPAVHYSISGVEMSHFAESLGGWSSYSSVYAANAPAP